MASELGNSAGNQLRIQLLDGLESWGTGNAHAAVWSQDPCPRCDGEGKVGDPAFPVMCPECRGSKVAT